MRLRRCRERPAMSSGWPYRKTSALPGGSINWGVPPRAASANWNKMGTPFGRHLATLLVDARIRAHTNPSRTEEPTPMKNTAGPHTGRHFLQIPGPTNVPDRVLQAIAMPTIDHRGPEFAALGQEVVAGMKRVFQTDGTVVIYPSSGTGAWEAALSNTLSPGDHVIMFETGHFATLWRQMATRLGLEVEFVPGDWRHGVDPALVEEKLTADREHRLKAVCAVHNETSTGVTSRIAEIRAAIDRAHHPALFMVDTISSLASIDYRHDDWKVDVTVAGSQKGLMLPPGLGFNAVSKKALAASRTARLPRSYWDWEATLETGQTGFFPYTPATNLLFGLHEALKMLLDEEGLAAVFD